MRPVANFLKSHEKKTAEEWRIPPKAKAVPPPELSNPWSRPPYLHPYSEDEVRRKHCWTYYKAETCMTNHFGKGHVDQDRYLSASSNRETNSLCLGHQSLLPKPLWTTRCLWRTFAGQSFSNETGHAGTADREKTQRSRRRLPSLLKNESLNALLWRCVQLHLPEFEEG